MHHGEFLLRGMAKEIGRISEGMEYDYYLKPIKREDGEALLDYVGNMRESLDNMSKMASAYQELQVKYDLLLGQMNRSSQPINSPR